MKASILIVEDEALINHFLAKLLQENGYTPLQSFSGAEAISLAASHCPDLILLDLGLPDMDGMAVMDALSQWSNIPLIVISARQEEGQRVEALDCGADDYITKPFSNQDLLARIRSVLRRSQKPATSALSALGKFTLGALTIDYNSHLVTVGDEPVHVTPIEYKILSLLSLNAGKVLTYRNIIWEIWGPYSEAHQLLRVNMANIRRKIEKQSADPKYIHTEMGVGYRMADELPGSPE